MSEIRKRRSFTPEYRREAARLVLDTGRPVTTIPGAPSHRIPDRVERRWDTGQLNRVWVSDITYLGTQGTDLVERAVRMAATLRGGLPSQLVLHSDRGIQYTSSQLQWLTTELGLASSVGGTGVCWDNALCESFWSTLKHEFYQRRDWPTRAEARTRVAGWIEAVYNRRRRHSSLAYETPVDHEHHFGQQSTTKQAA